MELVGLTVCRRCTRAEYRGCLLLRAELADFKERLERIEAVAGVTLPPVTIAVETPCRDALSCAP